MLPISISAAKQKFQDNLNKRWRKIWAESPRKEIFARIDAEFPFNRFCKELFKLSRNQANSFFAVSQPVSSQKPL
jgi:hypothetical protein